MPPSVLWQPHRICGRGAPACDDATRRHDDGTVRLAESWQTAAGWHVRYECRAAGRRHVAGCRVSCRNRPSVPVRAGVLRPVDRRDVGGGPPVYRIKDVGVASDGRVTGAGRVTLIGRWRRVIGAMWRGDQPRGPPPRVPKRDRCHRGSLGVTETLGARVVVSAVLVIRGQGYAGDHKR